jgi:hypothetical protein
MTSVAILGQKSKRRHNVQAREAGMLFALSWVESKKRRRTMKKLMIMLPLVVSLLGCSISRGGVASYSVVCSPYDSCVPCGYSMSPGYTWMALGLANPFWYFGSYWEYFGMYDDVPYLPDFAYISPSANGREQVKRRIDKGQLQDPNKKRRRGYSYPGRAYPDSGNDQDISRSDQGSPAPPPPDNDQRMSTTPVRTISPPSSPPNQNSSGRSQGNRKKK